MGHNLGKLRSVAEASACERLDIHPLCTASAPRHPVRPLAFGSEGECLKSRLNSSFQDILESGVRKDMAKRYLADHSMSLAELAFLLGYHDQSSFRTKNRAFKEPNGPPTSAVWVHHWEKH